MGVKVQEVAAVVVMLPEVVEMMQMLVVVEMELEVVMVDRLVGLVKVVVVGRLVALMVVVVAPAVWEVEDTELGVVVAVERLVDVMVVAVVAAAMVWEVEDKEPVMLVEGQVGGGLGRAVGGEVVTWSLQDMGQEVVWWEVEVAVG